MKKHFLLFFLFCSGLFLRATEVTITGKYCDGSLKIPATIIVNASDLGANIQLFHSIDSVVPYSGIAKEIMEMGYTSISSTWPTITSVVAEHPETANPVVLNYADMVVLNYLCGRNLCYYANANSTTFDVGRMTDGRTTTLDLAELGIGVGVRFEKWNDNLNCPDLLYNVSSTSSFDIIRDAYKQNFVSTGLPTGSFLQNIHLERISLPHSLTHIGAWAFFQTYILKRIEMPIQLTKIGYRAFKYLPQVACMDFSDTNLDTIAEEGITLCTVDTIIFSTTLKYVGKNALLDSVNEIKANREFSFNNAFFINTTDVTIADSKLFSNKINGVQTPTKMWVLLENYSKGKNYINNPKQQVLPLLDGSKSFAAVSGFTLDLTSIKNLVGDRTAQAYVVDTIMTGDGSNAEDGYNYVISKTAYTGHVGTTGGVIIDTRGMGGYYPLQLGNEATASANNAWKSSYSGNYANCLRAFSNQDATCNYVDGNFKNFYLHVTNDGIFARKIVGSRTIDACQPVLSIRIGKLPLVISSARNAFEQDIALAKEYDGTNKVVDSEGNILETINFDFSVFNGFGVGDDKNAKITAKGQYSQKNVGNSLQIDIAFTIPAAYSEIYSISNLTYSRSGSITPRTLSINTEPTVTTSKAYDGTTTAAITKEWTTNRIIGGEDVTVSSVANYADKNVGTNKEITIVLKMDGNDKGNYQLPSSSIYKTGEITAYPIKVLTPAVIAETKVYDGTTTAVIATLATLTEAISTDEIAFNQTAMYEDKNVGANKKVIFSISKSGADAGNYNLMADDKAYTAAITKRSLLCRNVSLNSQTKVYDGNARLNGGTMFDDPTDIINADKRALSDIGANVYFNDKNVGENKPLTIFFYFGENCGNDTNNYTLQPNTSFTGTITKYPTSFTAGTYATEKEYDGTTDVIFTTQPSITDKIPGDDIEVTTTAAYDSKEIGTRKNIAITYALNGADVGNYNVSGFVSSEENNNGVIKARTLQVNKVVVNRAKFYDGTTNVTILAAPSFANAINGDNISISCNAQYDNANIGTNKTITITYSTSGDFSNYNLPIVGDETLTNGIICEKIEGTIKTTADAYCQEDYINATGTVSGEPVAYRFAFSDEQIAAGFVDAGWEDINANTSAYSYYVPNSVKGGSYTIYIQFKNVYDLVDSLECKVTVGSETEKIVQVFADVISIVNLDATFNNAKVQWYHNGQKIDGANQLFYQDPDGLSGYYFFIVDEGTPNERRSCNFTNYVTTPKGKPLTRKLSIFPNPVEHIGNVQLEGMNAEKHYLQLFNMMGKQVLAFSFMEEQTQLNMAEMPMGTYTLCVDGETIKVVKQ